MNRRVINWQEVDSLENGHGVVFEYTELPSQYGQPVAFMPGYEWRNGGMDPIVVQILRPDSLALRNLQLNTIEIINTARQAIETFLGSKSKMRHGPINKEIFAHFNA